MDKPASGLSTHLQEQIELLLSFLWSAVDDVFGAEIRSLTGSLIQRTEELSLSGNAGFRLLEEEFRNLPVNTMARVIKALTLYFHTINKAEQLEIIRVVRQRESNETRQAPHGESLHEAIAKLRSAGCSVQDVLHELSTLDVQPTLTAHPTEARRRTVLERQEQMANDLLKLQRSDLLPLEKKQLLRNVENTIRILLTTDEVRAERLKVLDEVENELYFLSSSIWQALPGVQRELCYAIEEQYGAEAEPPVFLSYRSWVGGDRDGNPNVTADVTRETLRLLREKALELYIAELSDLSAELSLSENWLRFPAELNAAAVAHGAPAGAPDEQRNLEPFRKRIDLIIGRLKKLAAGDHNYKIEDFKKDLALVARALKDCGFARLASRGRLSDITVQARAFGFHLAALDVRQHSSVHAQTVAEILDRSGHAGFLQLNEQERLKILEQALQGELELQYTREALSQTAQETFALLSLLKETLQKFPGSIGSYVISMTHHASDLLILLLLFAEAGLLSRGDDGPAGPLDLVPLLETIEDLDQAQEKLDELLSHPLYRSYLKSRGDFQEIMLGYSDSNKDGGYLMANRQLQQAQQAVAEICSKHGLTFRIFHGRGGSIGRGGGRANRAILSAPPASRNGRVRFTEQGEVISFRYAMPQIAHRHLEQIINAVILSRTAAQPAFSPGRREDELMARCSRVSMDAYRSLIDAPDFWEFFTSITPIEHISRLPIASRPVARSGGAVTFNDLRAIPWVFAWTQTRYIVPGWFGVGRALRAEAEHGAESLGYLRELYGKWGFFRTLLDNACQELARCRLEISRHYSSLSPHGRHFHELIKQEFDASAAVVLKISGQARLLDINPVIRNLIAYRNPATDVLNLLQVELLARYQKAGGKEREALRPVIFASINAIAAAMQSTG